MKKIKTQTRERRKKVSLQKKIKKNTLLVVGTLLLTVREPFFITLPEFSNKIIVKWKFNVFEDKNFEYYLIIGRGFMNYLRLDILFSKQKVSWEVIEIPMEDVRSLSKYNFY